jgi:sodium-dependent dicarboxylate transporter 2/3/5
MLKRFIWFLPLILIVLSIFFARSLAPSLNPKAIYALIALVWMMTWWIFEILPLGVTALIPLVFFPLSRVAELKTVAPYYAHPMIFLFLGGFIIARALEKTNLDKRFALSILEGTGSSDKGIVIGFIISTASLSMWISNTAVAVMMVPIALSVVTYLNSQLDNSCESSMKAFSICLFLSIAYAANIGGIATPIGTPPNVVLLGYLDQLYGKQIEFWRWMLIAVPVAGLSLLIMYALLNFLFPYNLKIPSNFQSFIKSELNAQGKKTNEQKITLSVFMLTCSLWVFKDLLEKLIPFKVLNDSSIAIFGAILLFLIPTKRDLNAPKPVLNKSDLSLLPWDIVLLFGGGMSLAGAVESVELVQKSTEFLKSLNLEPFYLFTFVLVGAILFLTEIMSNVALCVVALPPLMSLAESFGYHPLAIALPAAFGSSFAFTMPISTPPNAIIFSTNKVSVPDMLKAGLILNILGLIVIMTVGYFLISLIGLP